MKFSMYSHSGEGAGLLHRLREEGNEVRLFIKDPDDRENWKGIIDHQSFKTPDESTVVIFDISGMGHIADKLKRKGIPVFGASVFADDLEHDRKFGLSVMQDCGIQIPDTYNYDAPKDWYYAEELVRANKKKRWVFKPSGEGLPTKLTYVGQDAEDLLKYMRYVKENFKEITDFILQEFVEGAIVSTELWCDGTRFVYPANHTVETKKLMNDDLGPSIGCSGNLIWPSPGGWIVDRGISRIEDLCVENEYCGPIDLNTIITAEGEVFGLEWTPRFGYDALPTILQLIDGDVGKLISDMARGQWNGEFPLKDEFAGGVHLSIPPYPLEPPRTRDVARVGPNRGIPIRGLNLDDSRIFFFEVMEDEDNDLVHAAGTGSIAVVSDASDSPEDCFIGVYSILDNAMVPDKQFRTDLGAVLPEMYEKVEEYANI